MQNVLGNSPLQAGLKILVWTGATMVVAPIAGIVSERVGSRPFIFAGLALQAGALAILAGRSPRSSPMGGMILPFIMAGAGMALVFSPSANALLSVASPSGRARSRRGQRDPGDRRGARGGRARVRLHPRGQLRLPGRISSTA